MTNSKMDLDYRETKGQSVAFLLNSFPNPSETFITDEIESLILLGYKVKVFSVEKPNNPLIHANAQAILESGIVTYLDEPTPIDKLLALAKLVIQPRKWTTFKNLDYPRWVKLVALVHSQLITRSQPDHIHCHYAAFSSQLAHIIGKLEHIPFSLTTHGYDVFFEPPENYPQLAEDATAIITISDFNRNYLLEKYRLPPKKLITQRCGIDLDFYETATYKPLCENQSVQLLTVARLHPVKGHKYLLEALALLKDQSEFSFNLKLVGDGPLRKELEELCKTLKIENEVHFLGVQNKQEVLEHLRSAHLFVLPSLSEGIPISLMEAMASHTAVIGPNINGVSELVSDSSEGILFKPGDTESLAAAILNAVSPLTNKQLAEGGFNKVHQNHSLSTNTRRKYSILLGTHSDKE